jgi:hypothetical protein
VPIGVLLQMLVAMAPRCHLLGRRETVAWRKASTQAHAEYSVANRVPLDTGKECHWLTYQCGTLPCWAIEPLCAQKGICRLRKNNRLSLRALACVFCKSSPTKVEGMQ